MSNALSMNPCPEKNYLRESSNNIESAILTASSVENTSEVSLGQDTIQFGFS